MKEPSSNLINNEQNRLFLCYCTFIMNLSGKKMSIQHVFVETLKNKKYRSFLKELLSLESDYEVVKIFLDFDPALSKSKYVTKYLNSTKKNNLTLN